MIFYKDFVSMKRIIIKDNSGKSGIYLITNVQTGDFYVGQAGDLAKRFRDYTNPSYLTRITDQVNSIIGRALKKYGYSNFSFTVLEYCDISGLDLREQYYFDKLNPVYNSYLTAQPLQVKLNPFWVTGFTDAVIKKKELNSLVLSESILIIT